MEACPEVFRVEDDDTLTATGVGADISYRNRLHVCPASALPVALDLVSSAGRRGQRRTDRDRLGTCTPRRLPRVFPTTALDLVFFRRAATATTRARPSASSPP